MRQHLEELVRLTRMHLSLFLREPEAMFWTFGFPIIISAVMGFAFRRGELPESRIAVLPGPGQAELIERLEDIPHVVIAEALDETEARRSLLSGKLDALLIGTDADGKPVLLLDPDRVEAETARLRIELALRGPGDDFASIEHPQGNGSRYIDFLYPGLLGLNLMSTGMWSVGFAIARMRQQKVLRRLLVTPMRKSSFLASLFFARLVFLILELSILIAFGVFVLEIPFRANWFSFVAVCVGGAAAFSGLGLLACGRSQTIEGASGMLNFVMMPMWLLSGVFFSYERFPDVMQPIIKLLPLTALNDSLRQMMLEGQSVVDILPELGVLGICGVGSFLIALKIFRWQ